MWQIHMFPFGFYSQNVAWIGPLQNCMNMMRFALCTIYVVCTPFTIFCVTIYLLAIAVCLHKNAKSQILFHLYNNALICLFVRLSVCLFVCSEHVRPKLFCLISSNPTTLIPPTPEGRAKGCRRQPFCELLLNTRMERF